MFVCWYVCVLSLVLYCLGGGSILFTHQFGVTTKYISWGWGGETNGVGRIFQEVVSQCVSCELIVSQSDSQYQGGIIEADRRFDQLKKGKCLTSDRVE